MMSEMSSYEDGLDAVSQDAEITGKNVTAVLGPTNTGKTHLAIQRMLAHKSGLIGLPLRLLAREVYDKITAQTSPADVALITGEERIKPANARYFVCTVEAMPKDIDVDFLAIDEIQLAADPERGYIFTNRLLHARGKEETLLLGAATMRNVISELLPGSHYVSRPRLSKLNYSGQKKITRLPRRSAIVAFSANNVYEIAELIRRQRGGAAVVLGALSPRTRNAQVQLYQSGDVDFLIATDAIGMGLNLDVNHVAFSAVRKFDGQLHRQLILSEIGQIAGRAGRHTNDGTFGVTGDVEPFLPETVTAIENHEYEPVKILQWRSANLDFSNLANLKASLTRAPKRKHMVRARMADDVIALENITLAADIRDMACSPAALKQLWDACQIPDYRKISSANHGELIATIYKFIMSDHGHIPEDWLDEQVTQANSIEGDIDTLSNRISHIRTWTFLSNRHNWLKDPKHWQARTRDIEDRLSDALHEKLTERFVDQRTSVLMKRLRDTDNLCAEIGDDGSIHVEKHYVGKLKGFRFSPDTDSHDTTVHGKAARNAAAKVLSKELSMRVRRISAAKSDAFAFTKNGHIQWRGEDIACVIVGEDPLKPNLQVLCDEHLSAQDRDKVAARLQDWLNEQIKTRLQPLMAMKEAQDIDGLARGIAFQLCENFGILRRDAVADDIRALDQNARGQLRKYGVRFGAFNIYFPLLLKPAAIELVLILWALKDGPQHNLSLNTLPEPPRAGLTSVLADATVPENFYRAAGYQVCGLRSVRIDMLERLADMIRPLTAWRDGKSEGEAPKGATGDGGFITQPEMMSIMGCSGEELASILRALGFRMQKRAVQNKAVDAEKDAETVEKGSSVTTDTSAPSESAVAISDDSGDTDETKKMAFEGRSDSQQSNVDTIVSEAEQTPATSDAVKAEEAESTDTRVDDQAAPDEKVSASDDEAAEEITYEEVWRPQRRKSHHKVTHHKNTQRSPKAKRDAHHAQSQSGKQASEQDVTASKKNDLSDNKEGQKALDGDDNKVTAEASSPSQPKQDRKPHKGKKGKRKRDNFQASNKRTSKSKKAHEFDPDSPFAALSALKKELQSNTTEK